MARKQKDPAEVNEQHTYQADVRDASAHIAILAIIALIRNAFLGCAYVTRLKVWGP